MEKTVASLEEILRAEPELSDKEIHRRTGWPRRWISHTRKYYIDREPFDPKPQFRYRSKDWEDPKIQREGGQ